MEKTENQYLGTAAFLSICQGRKDTKNAPRAIARQHGSQGKKIGEKVAEELYLTTSPAKYAIEAQDAVLKEIAKHGNCVIVGWAPYLLFCIFMLE